MKDVASYTMTHHYKPTTMACFPSCSWHQWPHLYNHQTNTHWLDNSTAQTPHQSTIQLCYKNAAKNCNCLSKI